MYKTSIKEKYRRDFVGFWKADEANEQYTVLLTMGNMSLLYCEDTGLLLDIFNNKLEVFRKIASPQAKVIIEAKNIDYAERFDLSGEYELVGFETIPDRPYLLKLVDNVGNERFMMPSRLRVVRIEEVKDARN